MPNIREITEKIEREILSDKAFLSSESRGRKREEKQDELRTDFQRDRDRIIHSKAFRRLKHKTQVFLSPESDHYRTRMTHTLEVSQVARTISRALRLNEDLTEAIAMGHDLGHTPFGHAGERALDKLTSFSFTHFEQSARVCERLEKNLKGLNLTYEVLDGIRNHTKGQLPETLEGQVVRIADRIAYINHDIDDAVRGDIIHNDDIPFNIKLALGTTTGDRITALVKSVVQNTDDVVKMDAETDEMFNSLHTFLFDNVYRNPKAKSEETKVDGIIEGLFNYFIENPHKMPEEFSVICNEEGVERAVADYIAGMTDHYAILTYSNIYIPKSWGI
ncbi:MAG: deoxyguanosinetriphosphate triphosphohydrolase [Ruminococcaceae bacterium]|nr:deoxyguanosinetriphosphate triphosphohydrolase [Oscillospiraceae bacterium]